MILIEAVICNSFGNFSIHFSTCRAKVELNVPSEFSCGIQMVVLTSFKTSRHSSSKVSLLALGPLRFFLKGLALCDVDSVEPDLLLLSASEGGGVVFGVVAADEG